MKPTSIIVLGVPARDIDRRHLDDLMCNGPVIEFLNRLSMFVYSPLRQHGDPNIVPHATESNPVPDISLFILDTENDGSKERKTK